MSAGGRPSAAGFFGSNNRNGIRKKSGSAAMCALTSWASGLLVGNDPLRNPAQGATALEPKGLVLGQTNDLQGRNVLI